MGQTLHFLPGKNGTGALVAIPSIYSPFLILPLYNRWHEVFPIWRPLLFRRGAPSWHFSRILPAWSAACVSRRIAGCASACAMMLAAFPCVTTAFPLSSNFPPADAIFAACPELSTRTFPEESRTAPIASAIVLPFSWRAVLVLRRHACSRHCSSEPRTNRATGKVVCRSPCRFGCQPRRANGRRRHSARATAPAAQACAASNQVDLLGRPLAKRLGLPYRPVLLVRSRPRPEKHLYTAMNVGNRYVALLR